MRRSKNLLEVFFLESRYSFMYILANIAKIRVPSTFYWTHRCYNVYETAISGMAVLHRDRTVLEPVQRRGKTVRAVLLFCHEVYYDRMLRDRGDWTGRVQANWLVGQPIVCSLEVIRQYDAVASHMVLLLHLESWNSSASYDLAKVFYFLKCIAWRAFNVDICFYRSGNI